MTKREAKAIKVAFDCIYKRAETLAYREIVLYVFKRIAAAIA